MNYPKRRASIACQKRRCSGERPSCQLCRSAGVSCQYVELVSPRERSTTANATLSRRVRELETLVLAQEDASLGPHRSHRQEVTPSTPDSPVSDSRTLSEPAAAIPEAWNDNGQASLIVDFSPGRRGRSEQLSDGVDEAPALTIPAGHRTITGSLFTLQSVKTLIGQYPLDLFFRIECSRDAITPTAVSPMTQASIISTVDFHHPVTQQYISNYFSTVHPHFTVLEHHTFSSYFEDVMRQDHPKGVDLAVCLLVLAIGALARIGPTNAEPYDDLDGMEYFLPAYGIVMVEWTTSVTPDMSLSTGLLLVAIYLRFIGRPLQSWKAVSMVSSTLQVKSLHATQAPCDDDLFHRLCWSCFVLECDALAEFHLPRTGIEDTIEHMSFPNFNSETSGRDEMLFLAFVSIRRLLNRIHNVVYGLDASPGLAITTRADILSLESVLTELVWQLSSWYTSLPDTIRPDLSSTPRDMHDAWLRLRYWSAKHIITRPCLFYATTVSSESDLPRFVVEYSEMCVHSCRNYIKTATHALKERTHYNWMTIQACLATSLVLSIASTSAVVKHLVPDLEDLLAEAIAALRPWTADPSADMVKTILEGLRRKHHLRILSLP